jgi:hypothetical protein
MATFIKFNEFVEELAGGALDLLGDNPGTNCDVLNVYLTNTEPQAAHSIGDLATITEQNGYAAAAITNNGSAATGTFTLSGLSKEWTAETGSFGPFRAAVVYDDTHASDCLVGAWDRGSSVTIEDGESFTIKFDDAEAGQRGDILTIA